MKNRTKVIDRIRYEAAQTKLKMPFERGAPRRAMITRRAALTQAELHAAAEAAAEAALRARARMRAISVG